MLNLKSKSADSNSVVTAESKVNAKIIKEIEFLRILSFTGVVLQHILGGYSRENMDYTTSIYIVLVFALCKFAVQAFFFITGFLFFMKPLDNFNYFKFLKNKFTSIIIPYIIFSIVFAEYRQINIFTLNFIKLLLLGEVSYHTWYMMTLTLMLILMPLWIFIFKALNKLNYKVSLGVTFFGGLLLCVIFENADKFGALEYIISIKATVNPVYYASYLLMGGIVGANYKKFNFTKIIPAVVIIFILSYIWTIYIAIEYSKNFNLDKVTLYIFTICVNTYLLSTSHIILILELGKRIMKNKAFSNIVVFLASQAYIAYLYHVLIFDNFYGLYYGLNLDLSYFNKYLLAFTFTTVLSLFIAYIFNKIYSKILLLFK